jgi:hypothetical protein
VHHRIPSRSGHPDRGSSIEGMDGNDAAALMDLFFQFIGAVADW